MTERDEKAAFKKAINEVLDERARIDAETHAAHHDFVASRIEERRRQREMWQKLKQQVLGWAIIALLVSFAAIVGDGIKSQLGKLLSK